MAAIAVETIQINNKDVEVYKITGHPTDVTIVLSQEISASDVVRLNEAASGTLAKSTDTKIDGVTVTDQLLNIRQAYLPSVNMWAIDYFKDLIKKLETVTAVSTKADISNHLVDVVYNLVKGSGGTATARIESLETQVSDLTARLVILEAAAT